MRKLQVCKVFYSSRAKNKGGILTRFFSASLCMFLKLHYAAIPLDMTTLSELCLLFPKVVVLTKWSVR